MRSLKSCCASVIAWGTGAYDLCGGYVSLFWSSVEISYDYGSQHR